MLSLKNLNLGLHFKATISLRMIITEVENKV